MSGFHLLVVEDDPDGQEVVTRILRHHQISYDCAATGEDAQQLLEQNDYHGAILDLALPGIDGWGLLKYIQNDSEFANMPCVAVTAFHSAEVAVEAIEAGFAAYFPKPLDATSFVRELESILAEGY